jgi:hypothetical protein
MLLSRVVVIGALVSFPLNAQEPPASGAGQLPAVRSADSVRSLTPREQLIALKNYLRSLVAAQEAFFGDSARYTDKAANLRVARPPQGVSLKSFTAGNGAWSAIAVSAYIPGIECAVAVKGTNPVVASAPDGEPSCK